MSPGIDSPRTDALEGVAASGEPIVEQPRQRRSAASVLLRVPEAGIGAALVVLCVVVALLNSQFATTTNIFNLLEAVSVTGILAVGMTFVIIAGELDLSVGSGVALSGLAAFMFSHVVGWPLAVLGGIVVAVLVGLASSLLVTKVGINSFIVTLGMLSVARGIALYVSDGIPQPGLSYLRVLGQSKIGPLPVQVLVLVLVVMLGQLLLSGTNFGNQVKAVGDNPEAARLAGLPVHKVKIACFCLLGVLVAVAAVLRSEQLGTAEPDAAVGLELDVIAATIIGGASLNGGRGSIVGAFLGAALLGVMRNAFVLLQLSNFLQTISTGVVIILAVLFDRLRLRYTA